MFALTGNLETEARGMVICMAVRYWSAERERTRNVMALEARWNLVLK